MDENLVDSDSIKDCQDAISPSVITSNPGGEVLNSSQSATLEADVNGVGGDVEGFVDNENSYKILPLSVDSINHPDSSKDDTVITTYGEDGNKLACHCVSNIPSGSNEPSTSHSALSDQQSFIPICAQHAHQHFNTGCGTIHKSLDVDPSLKKVTQCSNSLEISSDVHEKCFSSISTCNHLCSNCHVKVELSCLSCSDKSVNGGRSSRPFPFPKRVRHKVKPPTKDSNGGKKKKSPWSFRLNCRLRNNKQESSQESSSLSMSCVSCVCPRYKSEPEPVYRSFGETASPSNSQLPSPLVSVPRVGLQENARDEASRELSDINIHQDLFPLVRDTTRSLGLPFSYNSMLDLQALLESSLKLGLASNRVNNLSNGCNESIGQSSKGLAAQNNDSPIFTRTVHTQVDYIHYLVPDLLAITKCDFYWGKMDRYEAESLLEGKSEGTFLLRDSAQEEYLFSVSFRRYGRSLHARIEQWNHKFGFDSHDPGVYASNTVCGLIEHYKDPSCCMFFEPLLTHPLSRTFPFSLQHLCRAVTCANITYDGINFLELPKAIKNYLKEYHYKQQVRVRHLE